MLRLAILLLALTPAPLWALPLDLPNTARQTAARDSALAQVGVPIAPFGPEGLDTVPIEGPVTRRTYRLAREDVTPLQVLAPLRAQIEAAGYEVILDCDQDSCGGFDFRFAIEVLPAPNMYVNIRSYHFVSALAPGGGAGITVLASAAPSAAYLQVVSVGATPLAAPEAPDISPEPAPDIPPTDFTAALLSQGAVVLHDIEFAVGTTALSDAPSAELAELAALLNDRPGLQIALVGHTDTIGGLDANINVSRARATAVRTRLIEDHGVDPARVEAAGMGYLSPRASNLTEAGREANRRVEVIVVRDAGAQ